MPINPGIIAGLNTKPLEFGDPIADYSKAMQLRNLMQTGDIQHQQIEDANTIKQATMQAGGDPNVLGQNLLNKGMLKQYQDLQKSKTEQAEKQSITNKNITETQAKAVAMHRDQLSGVTNQQEAAQWVMAGFADPNTKSILEKFGTPESMIAKIPPDQNGLEDWKQKNAMGATKLAEMNRPKPVMVNLEDRVQPGLQDAKGGVTPVGEALKKGMSPTAAANAEDKKSAILAPEDRKLMAQQYLAGDKGVLMNLGRGTQGAQNLVFLRHEIGNQMRDAGASGSDVAAKMAEFAGLTAAQRTVGTRTANVELAANEAQNILPLAREASAKVARSGFLPFGKAEIMFDENTNNPDLRSFAAANNALVNVYARAISPQGVPTVHDKEAGRKLLSTAHDQASYNATLNMMEKEINAAQTAPKQVRKAFSESIQSVGKNPASEPSSVPTFDMNAIDAEIARRKGK